MKKNKFFRLVAAYLALTLVFDLCFPTVAFALTSGPSQPEVQSFEPVNTTEMVDPFSGDFNYNIPLLNVPGPNGGYPINLAYHSGIGMEQEASWTGLGWNVNVGALNRNMRGLPDDFSGEKVKRTLSTRPNVTVGVAYERGSGNTTFNDAQIIYGNNDEEVLGMETSDLVTTNARGMQLYYNNYRGVGLSFNASKS
ncbi:MAG: hypothetical protein ACRCYO_17190, partial [Bacteroidia bacterium]